MENKGTLTIYINQSLLEIAQTQNIRKNTTIHLGNKSLNFLFTSAILCNLTIQ